MKRSLIYILVVIVMAGWIGTLISRDPGYVLISYNGATLETGLWVMLTILLIIVVVAYLTLRLLGVLRGSTGAWRGWRANRKQNRSDELTHQGMTCFQAGEYERAERLLLQGADKGDGVALNYIFAARAVDALGDTKRRDSFLKKAVEADPSVKQAAAVARAEMSLEKGQFRTCLDSLRDCANNGAVVGMKKEALFELKDWQGLFELMPLLRKFGTLDGEFEKQVGLARLSENMTDDARKIVYKNLNSALRKDTDIVLAYCQYVASEAETEKLLRTTLKSHWEPDLVVAYGELGTATLAGRLKAARGWLKKHPNDYALHLCLGELYRLDGDQRNAKECYEKSLAIQPTLRACERLAELLSLGGDHGKSNEYFRQALKLKTTHNS